MAARNIAENKRFVFRSSDQKPKTHLVTSNGSKSNVSPKILDSQAMPTTGVLPLLSPPPPQPLVEIDIPRAEVTPARRVVVIRNTKHPQVNEGPVDLGNFGQPDSTNISPVINNGHKAVYFIRRPIAPSEPPESVE